MLLRGVFLLTLTLWPSCAYLSNRALDANEFVLADAQLGVGVSADAKAGPVAAGVGWSLGAYSVGKSTWWSGLHAFREGSAGVPLAQVSAFVGSASKGSGRGVFGLFATHGLVKSAVPGFDPGPMEDQIFARGAFLGIALPPERPMPDAVVDYFGVEAGVFLGVVGTRLGFNVAEFSEFLLGWFGLDILGDDVPSREKEQPPAEALTGYPVMTEEWGWE